MAKRFWQIQKSLVHIAYHKYIFLSDFFGYVPKNLISGTISDPSLVNILWLQVVCTKFKRKKILLSSSAFRLLKVIFGGYSGLVLSHQFSAMSSWNPFGGKCRREEPLRINFSEAKIEAFFGFRLVNLIMRPPVSSIADSGLKSLAQKIESQKITNLLFLSVTLVGDDAVVFGINRYVFFCNINSQSYYQLVKLFVIVT